MYDITKRKQFKTVGDLKALLKYIPDETQIVVTGDDYCWFHIEHDGSVICLDVEELDDAYEGKDVNRDDYYTPCDYGDCPYNAKGGYDCRNYCGLGVDENEEDNLDWLSDNCDYTPSATNGDYGPNNPWDAPGCSIDMFISGVID